MENDGKTFVIKCNNPEVHNHEDEEHGEGNVLMFLRKNSIFVKCGNCKEWSRVFITIPGINIDFSNATFTHKKMHKKYHFDALKAPTVIEDK